MTKQAKDTSEETEFHPHLQHEILSVMFNDSLANPLSNTPNLDASHTAIAGITLSADGKFLTVMCKNITAGKPGAIQKRMIPVQGNVRYLIVK